MLFGRYRAFLNEKRDAILNKAKQSRDLFPLENAIKDEFRCLVQELDRMEREVMETSLEARLAK